MFKNLGVRILFLITLSISFIISNELLNRKFLNNKLNEENSSYILIKNMIQSFLFENVDFGEKTFLSTPNQEKMLNITDFTLNALMFIGQRGFKLDITAKNDSNPLPVPIDSNTLSSIVEEFSKFEKNTNMSLRIYEDASKHKVPKIFTDTEGTTLMIEFGMDFGIFKDGEESSTQVLSINVPLNIKFQFEVTNNLFTLSLANVNVKDVTINHDELTVNIEKLEMGLEKFVEAAFVGLKDDVTKKDVLTLMNNFTGSHFTKFDMVTDYGYILILLGDN
jgi:hypothetical protein